MNKLNTGNKNKDNDRLPSFLKPFLWSYALDKMDKEKDKNIIIKNILDLGTAEATDWLKKEYTEEEIKKAIQSSVKSDWSKKSINLWELIYEVSPKENRF